MSSHDTLPPSKKYMTIPTYGVVMYDFVAENADELEAKAGEVVWVVSQDHADWVFAK